MGFGLAREEDGSSLPELANFKFYYFYLWLFNNSVSAYCFFLILLQLRAE